MRKSTKGSSTLRKRKAAVKLQELAAPTAKHSRNEDRISQLADDILISIISRLPLREATATSILSSRWRYLCTYTTNLNFPPFKPKIDIFNKYLLQEVQEKRFPNYINMINHILDSHKGSQVKEFRVHMPCLEGATIERWLEFAFAKKVEIIDISMHGFINARHGRYSLQLFNLIGTKGGQPLPGLKCLKELSLSSVDVEDGEIELLLSNFPLLESLSIGCGLQLENVLIDGHSSVLKHLSISHAANLQSVEIGNMMNLVSLRCYYLSHTYVLQLYNVPKLIEFSTSDLPENRLAEVLSGIPSCIHDQLRVFKLSYCPMFLWSSLPLPELKNIQHLEVELRMSKEFNRTFRLYSLFEACPSLEILEIKFLWREYSTKWEQEKITTYYSLKKWSPNLRKLKLSGYLGWPSELELALFVIKNAVALGELIVEPYGTTKRIRQLATARARRHFRPITPPSVNLIIN